MEKKFVTAKDAAEMLGITMGYLYKLTHLKKIPYYSPGGKKMFFKESELNEWIERSRVSTNEELESKIHNMR